MKKYSYKIGSWDESKIFSPIRNKWDSITLIMKTLKIMMTNNEISEENSIGEIVLIISKMSRLFFFTDKKYFSVNFPFFVKEIDGELHYSSSCIDSIDSMVTSQVLSIVSSVKSQSTTCVIEFSEEISDLSEVNRDFWPFFRELLVFEDGYIRYDHDPIRAKGRLHPLCHYDVFYSTGTTFKVGLNNPINKETIIDLLHTESECHFFE